MALTARQAKRWMWGIGLLVAAVAIGSAFFLGEKAPHYVQGRIEIDSKLEDAARESSTLFIVLYAEDQNMPQGGPPYAAYKFTLRGKNRSGVLHQFHLTDENIQKMPGSSINPNPTSFRVKARLDRDGLGGADSKGDIVGEAQKVPMRNSEPVVITLNRPVE